MKFEFYLDDSVRFVGPDELYSVNPFDEAPGYLLKTRLDRYITYISIKEASEGLLLAYEGRAVSRLPVMLTNYRKKMDFGALLSLERITLPSEEGFSVKGTIFY
jgi:hypothetical protein